MLCLKEMRRKGEKEKEEKCVNQTISLTLNKSFRKKKKKEKEPNEIYITTKKKTTNFFCFKN